MSNHGKFNPNNLDGRPKKERFKLNDGSNIFRILPPFGSLAKDGIIAKYWAVYWVKDSRGKPKPIVSILQMDKEKRIIQADPMYDSVEQKKKDLEALKAKGAPEALVEAMQKSVDGLRIDKGYYINAMNVAGQIGQLKLRYTAFQDLKLVIKQLQKDGVDPINVGPGVFLDFQKLKNDQGKTYYKVQVHQKTYRDQTSNKMVTEMVEAPIDQETLVRMDTEAYDLSSLFKILSPEEQALAATLDPSVIDRLFARAEDVTDEGGEDEGEDLAVAPVAQKAAPATATATQAAGNTAAVQAPTSVAAAPAPTPTPVAPTPSVAAPVGPGAVGNQKDLQDMVGKFLRGQL